MTNLLKPLRNTVLAICLTVGSVQSFAASKKNADGKLQQEVQKFCAENDKMRVDFIQSMREVHLKHVNELYDKRLAHNKEINELWKTLKPGDKAGKAAILEQIKIKQEDLNKEEERSKVDFKENIIKKKNKEFRDTMDERFKNLKDKHKD